jgi:repressor LexA
MTDGPKKLTKRQKMVLNFIIDHIDDEGYPPTIREIGDHLGIRSTNGVNDHLKALERKGYLERQDAKSRALKPLLSAEGECLIEAANNVIDFEDIYEIPVVGRIAAGLPISAIENTTETLHLGQGLIGRHDNVFGLVVKGDSMIEDGIFDGDYIFVKRQEDARDGEIVAAMVDGEATVKRIYREGKRVRLQPSNSSMDPIYVHADEARETLIIGKVVGVFRKLS